VVAHVLEDGNIEVDGLFYVCARTVYRYVERSNLTGEVRKSVKHNGPYPVLNESQN